MTDGSGRKRCSLLCTVARILPAFSLLLGSAGASIEPVGSNVGALQFDSIIELNSVTHGSCVLLFARYWVGPGFYFVGVVWAEPHGSGLDFSVYPPTLRITSDRQEFRVAHDVRTEYNMSFKKPVGEREVFRCMYGDYPLVNLQFVDEEAAATRVRASDLLPLAQRDADGDQQVLNIPARRTDEKSETPEAHLRVRTRDGRISSMQWLDQKGTLLKSIDYEYGQDGQQTYLLRQNVHLAEHPIKVGLQGDGVVVRVRGKTYKCRDFEAVHHEGGRRCTVEYKPLLLGERRVVVPVLARVWDGEHQNLLRSAHMMNFKRIESDPNRIKDAVMRFSGFTVQQLRYRELLLKYWQKPPAEVTEPDLRGVSELQRHFEESLTQQDTVGGRLKHVNILMELDRIGGNSTELRQHYRRYLSLLSENGLTRVIQVGGYGAIETLTLWGRFSEATILLDEWMDSILASLNDRETLLQFSQEELKKAHFWTTARLLERSLATRDESRVRHFEIQAVRCMALSQLSFLLSNQTKQRPKHAEAQVAWVESSIGRETLEQVLSQSLDDALLSFGKLVQPTRAQEDLREELARIAERIKLQNAPGGVPSSALERLAK